MIRVAVAYQDGEIFEHFGHCETFAVYEFDEQDLDKATKRLVDSSAFQGHQEMADLMKREKVDAVICGSMGQEAHSLLLSYGIIPVAGYCGDADTAAELLVTGQLPTSDGGGCGGCPGCSPEGGGGCSCGCGGSCGC